MTTSHPPRTTSSTTTLVAAAAIALAAWPPLYATAVRWMLARNMRRLREGDMAPLLASYADDVHFVFPGESSWKADLRGKEEVAVWVARFLRVGLELTPEQILVSGPPWNTTICIRFTDHLTLPDGTVAYENRGTMLGTVVWGRLRAYEVHEDTQKSAALDEWLAVHEPPAP
jgi:ketosteroid isomerase-like protein